LVETLAIIPARAGSKRVKDKNIRNCAGKPLIAWSIEAALNSFLVDRVIVSTDSAEIAAIAEFHGAEVPFLRAPELSGEDVPTLLVLQDALNKLSPYSPDLVVLLQPTSPTRTSADVDSAIQIFRSKPGLDSLVSCQKIPHQFHPEKLLQMDPQGLAISSKSEAPDLARVFYARNGPSIAISKYETILAGSIYGAQSLLFEMPVENSIDIDTEYDLSIAEFQLEKIKKNSASNDNWAK
jgi:CMP-N-acetylneuraminic acid synthetase